MWSDELVYLGESYKKLLAKQRELDGSVVKCFASDNLDEEHWFKLHGDGSAEHICCKKDLWLDQR